MATVVLLRHGRTTANASGVLAGRSAGVRLDEVGRAQARAAAERLAAVRLAAVVASPLQRCRETAAPVAAMAGLPVETERGLSECDYGDWQGRTLKELTREALWPVVQHHPSAVTFPGGESMPAMAARAAEAVRGRDTRLEAEHGADAVWVAVTHGDIVKAVVADALGLHLDLFQRIAVDPGSLTIIRYATSRPYVLGLNTHAGDLGWLTPPKRRRRTRRTSAAPDGVLGGGAGPAGDAG